jgi:hypothetical protein
MHKVVIEHINPIDAIERKNQLIKDGLVLDKDFFWAYSPATYDNDGYSAVSPKAATFRFATASLATFYKLKWS